MTHTFMDAMGKDTDRLSFVVALIAGAILALIMDAVAPIGFADFLEGHDVPNGD